MEHPTRKAVFRAKEDFELKNRRAREDYEKAIYRAVADGIDHIYYKYPWNYERFMELRDGVLDSTNRLLQRGDYNHPDLLSLKDNNMDGLALNVLKGWRLSSLLSEYERPQDIQIYAHMSEYIHCKQEDRRGESDDKRSEKRGEKRGRSESSQD